jgi:eukaryotic-like serine/threonine-protein kinase
MTAAVPQDWGSSDTAPATGPGRGSQRKPRLAPGTTIAHKYVLRGILGAGGWAIVYDAEHVELGHRIAIKVLHVEDGAPDQALERFQREARLSATARHRNILQVHDVGALEDGSPFLVMERLEGEDLDRRLDRGGLSVPAVVELGRQLLMGLAALADKGIVHRDIKPHNLVLHREVDGQVVVKLVDFGISKARMSPVPERTLTGAGMVIGTPHYMAPEQIQGAEVDHRTDIYAASVVLYEALTGVTPFDASSAGALLASVLRDPVPPPRAFRRNCPPSLERVLLQGLAKAPEERFAHPRQMLDALTAVARDLDLPEGNAAWAAPDADYTRPTDPLVRMRDELERRARSIARSPQHRRRAACAGAAGMVLGIVGGALVSLHGGADPSAPLAVAAAEAPPMPESPPQPIMVRAEATPPAPAPKAQAPEPRPRPSRALSLCDHALAAYVRGQVPRAHALYQRAVALDPSRAEAWRGLGLSAARMGRREVARSAFERYLRLAPDAQDARAIRRRLEAL